MILIQGGVVKKQPKRVPSKTPVRRVPPRPEPNVRPVSTEIHKNPAVVRIGPAKKPPAQ